MEDLGFSFKRVSGGAYHHLPGRNDGKSVRGASFLQARAPGSKGHPRRGGGRVNRFQTDIGNALYGLTGAKSPPIMSMAIVIGYKEFPSLVTKYP